MAQIQFSLMEKKNKYLTSRTLAKFPLPQLPQRPLSYVLCYPPTPFKVDVMYVHHPSLI